MHGLNAVFLENYGWYRVDPRGNKDGVNAQFKPPTEQLAFSSNAISEADLLEIWPEPLPRVVSVLEKYNTYQDVNMNLSDIELV